MKLSAQKMEAAGNYFITTWRRQQVTKKKSRNDNSFIMYKWIPFLQGFLGIIPPNWEVLLWVIHILQWVILLAYFTFTSAMHFVVWYIFDDPSATIPNHSLSPYFPEYMISGISFIWTQTLKYTKQILKEKWKVKDWREFL